MELFLVSDHELTGSIGGVFSKWTKVQEIALNDNLFVGNIPSGIGVENPLLTRLRLDGNDFTGPIPPSIGSLAELEYLGLGDNSLQGAIPGTVGSLGKLSKFMGRFSGLLLL